MEDDLMNKEKKWYQNLTYNDAKILLQEKLMNMKRNFISAGYYLKFIRDNELYLEEGYKSIWDFAEDNYGIKRSTCSRWMLMNDKFSKDGNTPILADGYKDFGKSQLQEMLYLEDSQLEQVTPDMTVKEIREIRTADPEEVMEKVHEEMCDVAQLEEKIEEPVSILGYPLRVYPEGSLIATPGCGKYDCYSCHRDGCDLRQEECYCVEAPMGNPFPCTTLNVVENLRQEVGNRCQFVNEDLAYHREGDGQPAPCCKECNNPCGYECNRSVNARHREVCDSTEADMEEQIPGQMTVEDYPELMPEENVIDAEYKEVAAKNTEKEEEHCTKSSEPVYVEIAIRDYLKEEEHTLAEYEKVNAEDGGLPYNLMMRQRILVKALRLLMEHDSDQNDDESEEVELEQPELPALRNNDQRKEWLNDYKSWGLWYRDENIDVNYYKYDFQDGSRLVVAEYPQRESYWGVGGKDEYFYHLLEKNKNRYGGTVNETYDEKYRNSTDSETYLVEFLKNLQKGEKK